MSLTELDQWLRFFVKNGPIFCIMKHFGHFWQFFAILAPLQRPSYSWGHPGSHLWCPRASPNYNTTTLSSNTTATKETFIMFKVFIMRNSALYHLKAYNLPFFHAKHQSSLVSTWFSNLKRFPLKTSFLNNLSCKNCSKFMQIE